MPKIKASITINGKRIFERFNNKTEAKQWKAEMRSRKVSNRHGLPVATISNLTFGDFARVEICDDEGRVVVADGEFMKRRKLNYGKATWGPDAQRLRDYLIPKFGKRYLNDIKSGQVRQGLLDICDEHKLSTATRDRLRALMSAVYSDALNREHPLVDSNPCAGIRFGGKRISANPSHIESSKAADRFKEKARELGWPHFIACLFAVNAGLRKQEIVPLRWCDIDWENGFLNVSRKYLQWEDKIVSGTKRGENFSRPVPIPEEFLNLLKEWRLVSKFNKDKDFILPDSEGGHMKPRMVWQLVVYVREAVGESVTVHGLRHTYGREFAQKSGNIGALKDILGHSTLAVTELYSRLGKDRLAGFREVVGVKKKAKEG